MFKKLSIFAIVLALLAPTQASASGVLIGQVDLAAAGVTKGTDGISFTLSGTISTVTSLQEGFLDVTEVDPACFENLEVVVTRLGPRRKGPRGVVATSTMAGTTFSIPVGPVAPGVFAVVVRPAAPEPTTGAENGSGWGWIGGTDPWNSGWDQVGPGWGSGTGATNTSDWVWDAEIGGWAHGDGTPVAPCSVALGGLIRVVAPA